MLVGGRNPKCSERPLETGPKAQRPSQGGPLPWTKRLNRQRDLPKKGKTDWLHLLSSSSQSSSLPPVAMA